MRFVLSRFMDLRLTFVTIDLLAGCRVYPGSRGNGGAGADGCPRLLPSLRSFFQVLVGVLKRVKTAQKLFKVSRLCCLRLLGLVFVKYSPTDSVPVGL